MQSDCVFCRIIEERSSQILLETDFFVVLFSIHPVEHGHSLIIPKKHSENAFGLSSHEWQDFFHALAKTKEFLDREVAPQGYNIGSNAGEVAGQNVLHTHIHVIPRHAGKRTKDLQREFPI